MRDFRDAKTMAHTLRNALQSRAVAITHGDCLELIAKAFGYDNWNILAAKIEAAKLRAQEESTAASDQTLYCSFCGKSQHDVAKLIAGPAVFICNECVDLCNDIIRDETPVWKVLSLLVEGEKSGSDAYAAALEHARGQPTERIASYVEQGRQLIEHNRGTLRQIDRLLERPPAPPTDEDLSGSPRFAYLNQKTSDELRAMRAAIRRAIDRVETALRVGTQVLREREP
jgi:hypothetical protein